MTNASRKTARKALAGILKTALQTDPTVTPADGKLVVTVYDHIPPKFEESPVVCIGSVSTAPAGQGLGNTGPAKQTFRYQTLVFVAVGESSTYTASDADDLLDDIEASIRGLIRSNPVNDAWSIIRFAGQQSKTQPGQPTRIVPVKVAGKKYNLEVISVDVEVYDQ